MASSINASTTGSGAIITTADNTGVLELQSAGTAGLTVDTNRTTTLNSVASNSPLITKINGTEVFRVASSGSVGINTSSPSSRMSVIGTSGQATVDIRNESSSDLIYTWGNTTGSAGTTVYVMPIRTGSTATLQGGLYWNGSTLSLQGSSDYRLKENVAPLQNGLDKIAQLNPVSYIWKESGNQGKGFIAHELQAVIPEAVVGEKDAVDDDGNIKAQSIDQTQIIVYLTKAIQELKAEVDTLKAKVGS